jgi:hypothetical protein
VSGKRLAAIACAELPSSSRPIVCAAHLDRLPAAASAQPTAGSGTSGTSGGNPLVYAAAGLALLIAAGLAVLARRRRLKRRQA